ncbi:MAG: Ldh family oxidoreductase [Alicyclobacillus macrosporangiidus]|uniref:Ldh family oxidoreductase n=1 Tax=Alicyclobacillus macrosporangiidus TaxID=392015 RepID=UPI0026E98C15|nr:Ldh family oxidoreductase [Alicyclobacillus macrosporangiidus]MCL6600152.1 Ldh family oxidoreductase [Alicyclobacillus macrosporangiidus]
MTARFYSTAALHRFTRDVFMRAGVPAEDADWTAQALVQADLQGLSSHGVSRLAAYVNGIVRGKVKPVPAIRVTESGPAIAMVDGDDGLGPVVAKVAMEAAMDRAERIGVGVVTVRNGNHIGSLSIYTEMAMARHLIGVALCNGQSAIPPWGGRRPYFGTNPIALAAPHGDGEPVSIDMATSVVARGKIILAAKRGEPIPEGWALDEHGRPTTDPVSALRGAVLPMAGAKGYGLALAVEVLSGVLSGAQFGDRVGSVYDDSPGMPGTGMFFMALNPAFFIGQRVFADRMEALVRDIRAIPPADGFDRVYLPGERRRHTRRMREAEGIPVPPETMREFEQLSQQYNVPLPPAMERNREQCVRAHL